MPNEKLKQKMERSLKATELILSISFYHRLSTLIAQSKDGKVTEEQAAGILLSVEHVDGVRVAVAPDEAGRQVEARPGGFPDPLAGFPAGDLKNPSAFIAVSRKNSHPAPL